MKEDHHVSSTTTKKEREKEKSEKKNGGIGPQDHLHTIPASCMAQGPIIQIPSHTDPLIFLLPVATSPKTCLSACTWVGIPIQEGRRGVTRTGEYRILLLLRPQGIAESHMGMAMAMAMATERLRTGMMNTGLDPATTPMKNIRTSNTNMARRSKMMDSVRKGIRSVLGLLVVIIIMVVTMPAQTVLVTQDRIPILFLKIRNRRPAQIRISLDHRTSMPFLGFLQVQLRKSND